MAKKPPINNWTPRQRIWIFSIGDIFFSWIVPVIIIALQYKLFEIEQQNTQLKATGITYVLLLFIVSGLIWRGKALVELTRNNGLKYALTKSMTPFLLLFFWAILGISYENIEKLRFVFFWSALSMMVAIVFRFFVGQATKELDTK